MFTNLFMMLLRMISTRILMATFFFLLVLVFILTPVFMSMLVLLMLSILLLISILVLLVLSVFIFGLTFWLPWNSRNTLLGLTKEKKWTHHLQRKESGWEMLIIRPVALVTSKFHLMEESWRKWLILTILIIDFLQKADQQDQFPSVGRLLWEYLDQMAVCGH